MTLTMMVEWVLGSFERFNWDGEKLVPRNPPWPVEWGAPPVNYGVIPGYDNPADKSGLDAIWAGLEPLKEGMWLEGEVLGMIWLNDFDHKIIRVVVYRTRRKINQRPRSYFVHTIFEK